MKTFYILTTPVFVDDDDYERVTSYAWYLQSNGYVAHKTRTQSWLLHRFVLNYDGPLFVDHYPDGNKCNCCKSNLRIVERWVNNLNQNVLPSHNTSGVTGVSRNKVTGKFEAYISIDDKKRYLGSFNTIEEARTEREEFEKNMLADHSLRTKPYLRLNNRSGIIGVCKVSATGKWKAKYKNIHLGFFSSLQEAVSARNKAEQLDKGTI